MMSSGRGYSLPRLFDVLLDEVDDAVDERVRQPRLDRAVAPGQIVLLLRARALDRRGELHQPLGGIRAAVEDDVLDALEQILRDVLVDDRAGRR